MFEALLQFVALLAWPVVAFVWNIKIYKKPTNDAVGASVIAFLSAMICGYLLSDVLWMLSQNGRNPLLEMMFSITWIGAPFLTLGVLYLFKRKKVS